MQKNTIAMVNIADREKFSNLLNQSDNVQYVYDLHDLLALDDKHHLLCMVVDFTSKHTNSLEFMRNARGNCISAPLIPIFTPDQREIMLQVATLGVYDILLKPICVNETSKILSKVIEEQVNKDFTTSESPINHVLDQLSILAKVEASPIKAHTPNILLVEDSEDLSILLKLIFRKYGCNMTCVDCGPKALTEFKSKQYDIVITDYSMPIMNGPEIAKAIREWEQENNIKTIPILALSGHKSGGMEEEQMKIAGCNDFISKTPSFNDLLSVVGNYINTSYK